MVPLFVMVYVVSYMTRLDFAVIVAEMTKALSIPKSLLSLSLTGSFISYGIGQLISGRCGDILPPKKLVSLGLLISALMNLGIPFCSSPYTMLFLWSLNGLAQAFIWPPLVKMLSTTVSDEQYSAATTKVIWGGSIGTILIYLIGPLAIAFSGWKMVFRFCAFCGFLMVIFWNILATDTKADAVQAKGNGNGIGMLLNPLMFLVMIAIILQGMLRDGIATWIPSLISETFHLSSEISILTAVILPVFSILSVQVASVLYRKKIHNPLTLSMVFFASASIAAGLLLFVIGRSAFFSVLFSAVLNACMHGVNLILVSFLPIFFKRYGQISMASGILNFCTYIGSALSTYGIAVIAEGFGWNTTILAWMGIAMLGALITALCIKPWLTKYGKAI